MNLKEYIKQYIRELLDEESTSGDAGAYNTPFAFSKKKQKKTAEQWGMKLAPEGSPSDSKVMDYKNLTGQKKKKYKLYKEGESKPIEGKEYTHEVEISQGPHKGEIWKTDEEFQGYDGEQLTFKITKVYNPELEKYFKSLGINRGVGDITRTGQAAFGMRYNEKNIEESDYDKASPYTAASKYGAASGYTGVGKDNHPNGYYGEKSTGTDMKESLLMNIIKEELLNEVTYSKFKTEVKFRTKNEQLHKAIREVKRKLNEIDRIVEYTTRMKQELSEGEEGLKYWKGTEKNIAQISETINKLTNKIKNLHQ